MSSLSAPVFPALSRDDILIILCEVKNDVSQKGLLDKGVVKQTPVSGEYLRKKLFFPGPEKNLKAQ